MKYLFNYLHKDESDSNVYLRRLIERNYKEMIKVPDVYEALKINFNLVKSLANIFNEHDYLTVDNMTDKLMNLNNNQLKYLDIILQDTIYESNYESSYDNMIHCVINYIITDSHIERLLDDSDTIDEFKHDFKTYYDDTFEDVYKRNWIAHIAGKHPYIYEYHGLKTLLENRVLSTKNYLNSQIFEYNLIDIRIEIFKLETYKPTFSPITFNELIESHFDDKTAKSLLPFMELIEEIFTRFNERIGINSKYIFSEIITLKIIMYICDYFKIYIKVK